MATAAHLYEECDGLEFERSSNRYIVRMHMSKAPGKATCLVLHDMFCDRERTLTATSTSTLFSCHTPLCAVSQRGHKQPWRAWQSKCSLQNWPCSLGRQCGVPHSWCKAFSPSATSCTCSEGQCTPEEPTGQAVGADQEPLIHICQHAQLSAPGTESTNLQGRHRPGRHRPCQHASM